MLNFYSSGMNPFNHFRHNEESNGYAAVKSKLTKVCSTPRHTIVYRKYPCGPTLQAKLIH